jgi:signal transduction histidine kinase
LAGRPLAEALAALARQFTSDTGVRVHVKSRGDESLPLRIEADLYRIATEALTNVRKHAHASLVEVALQPSEHEIQLSIHDDGRGFDRREITQGDHHGMIGMRERARLLGGHLRVASRPGRGTTVTARVPLPDEVEA